MKATDLLETVKRIFSYDKDTGEFTRIVAPQGTKVGDTAGSLGENGYVRLKIDYKTYRAHRIAWLYHYGKFPDGDIDHINHNKSDNRICNLRDVPNLDNQKNKPILARNKSDVTGVSWSKERQKWVAFISVNSKTKNLGRFKNKYDAIKARRDAEIKYKYHDNHGKDMS